jgi:hypothetical protein
LRRGLEQWVLCVAGISQLLAVNHYLSYYYDDRYTVQSILFCIFAISLLAAYWPPKKEMKEPEVAKTPEAAKTSEAAKTPATETRALGAGNPAA